MTRWAAGRAADTGPLVAVLSGANMNFDRLRFVAERAEVGESREAVLAVTIPERPGAFREFCTRIGRRVVTEFNYRLSGRGDAHIFVGVAVNSRADGAALRDALVAAGCETHELTDNELAKLHVRHMVGGRSAHVVDEQVYRFEFPERPGALMRFLDALGGRWNISMFHYRNHGADPGRVLAGFEVPPEDMPAFERFLVDLGYPAQRETDTGLPIVPRLTPAAQVPPGSLARTWSPPGGPSAPRRTRRRPAPGAMSRHWLGRIDSQQRAAAGATVSQT